MRMPGYERPGTANFYEARSGETSLSNNYKRAPQNVQVLESMHGQRMSRTNQNYISDGY